MFKLFSKEPKENKFHEDIVNNIEKWLHLSENHVDFYYGGSFRFQYKIPDDIDIFINANTLKTKTLLEIIKQSNENTLTFIGIYEPDTCRCQVSYLNTNSDKVTLDITLYTDNIGFNNSKGNHLKIDNYLSSLSDNEYTAIMTSCEKLINGSDVYNFLLNLSNKS